MSALLIAGLLAAAPGPLLEPVKDVRGEQYIVDFVLEKAVEERPMDLFNNGILSGGPLSRALGECGDTPSGGFAQQGAKHADEANGLVITVEGVTPAGKSGRGWVGVRCAYRIADARDTSLWAPLDAKHVPKFNALSGIVRDGAIVYASLQFNGYAKEIGRRGNLVVALDLAKHTVLWTSPDLVSNASMFVRGPYLVTGYGFTAEPDFVYVLDRATGKVVQKLKVPTGPAEMAVTAERLYVRTYDGYSIFRFLVAPSSSQGRE